MTRGLQWQDNEVKFYSSDKGKEIEDLEVHMMKESTSKRKERQNADIWTIC